jgi:predicted outer membrane repeat protein
LLRCKFDSNTAQRHGGAIYVHDGIGNPTWEYVGCVFDSNTAENSGGAVYELNAAEAPIYLNSLFVLNEARGTAAGEGGGAIRNGGNSAVSYVNCTFVDNMATGGAGGGILGASNASPVVTNGIFWDNCDGSGCTTEDEDAQIQIQGSGNDDSVTHSTIEGCADPGFCEELSNKATEPTFVGSGAHPYQLQDVAANDNLIDGGDGENVSGDCLSVNTTTQDLTGGENTRFIRDDGMCGVETAVTVDMGAYEVQ